jgi:beta-fructofuranosidase
MMKRIVLCLACCLVAPYIAIAGVVYQSPEKMWDTWLLRNGEDYHLFFLSKGNIGRAVSKDLIHWEHLPPIENMAREGDWDADGMMMTGCTVKQGDTYYLAYGGRGKGTPIGLLQSDDLMNWKRVGDPVLTAKDPYLPGDHWRDLSPVWNKAQQQWDGYLFGIHARTKRGSIAHVTSKDFLNWTYHDPLFITEEYQRDNDGFVYLEVPDLFEMGGKYYVTFSSIRSRKNFTSGRQDASGTWYIMADKKEGPYRVPKNPLLLGTGMGRFDHYVGRTITHKGDRLLYHQNWGRHEVDWSTPKLLRKDRNHELYLKYWPALDGLKTRQLLNLESLSVKPAASTRYHEKDIEIQAGDFMLTCDLQITNAKNFSIFWRRNTTPYGLRIEPEIGAFSIVQLHRRVGKFNSSTYRTLMQDQYVNKALCTDKMTLRLMVRKGRSEVYINDRWIFNVGLEDIPAEGDFSFLADSGETLVENLQIHELEPLAPQY